MQFLAFAFVYRLFEKLKSFESPATRTYNVSLYPRQNIQWNYKIFYFWTMSNFQYNWNSSSWSWLQEEGEDTGEGLRMGKRLLRSLALVFGCVAVSSVVMLIHHIFGVTTSSVVYLLHLWYNFQCVCDRWFAQLFLKCRTSCSTMLGKLSLPENFEVRWYPN